MLRRLMCCLLLALLPQVHAAALEEGESDSGVYSLVGLSGVEAQLLLNEDGSFRFVMQNDEQQELAEGRWFGAGDELVDLYSAPLPAPSLQLAGQETETLTPSAGLEVLVGNRTMELMFSGFEVVATRADGSTEQQATAGGGMVVLGRADDAQPFTQISVSSADYGIDPTHFDVPAGVRQLQIELQPGSLRPHAFEFLRLRRLAAGVLTLITEEGQLRPGLFMRQ